MFDNKFLYTDEDGYYQSRHVQYLMPLFENAKYTVFKDIELPEMMFDSEGEIIVAIHLHRDLE